LNGSFISYCIIFPTKYINLRSEDILRFESIHHASLVVRPQPKIVLDLLHVLAAVLASHQHSPVGGVGCCSFAATDVPGIANHQLEIVLVVDVGPNVGVVVDELVQSYFAIVDTAHIKSVQELCKYFFR